MLTKLFIFGLLSSTVCPLSNAEFNEVATNSTLLNEKTSCDAEIEWIKNTTFAAKKQFSDYYTQLGQNRIYERNLDGVNSQLDNIHQVFTDSLRKYTVDLNNVVAVISNVSNPLEACTEELEKYSMMSQNLSILMQSTRQKAIDLAKKLGLSPGIIQGLDRSLGRMVLLATDIGNHTVEHKFIEKVAMIEQNVHTEESASGIAKNQVNPRGVVPNPTTEAMYEDYNDAKDEKAFDDLINNRDRAIEKADKDLFEREKYIELLQKQLAAEEKDLLKQNELNRIKQLKENEVESSLDIALLPT